MLFYSILALAALAFAWLSYVRPLWSLYLTAALLPTYLIRFQIGFLPFTWLETMILLLALAMLLSRQFDWKKISSDFMFWPALLLIVVALVAVFVSPDKLHALGAFKAYFVEPIIFYFLAISIIKDRRSIEGLFWALGLSVLYLGVLAIGQKFWPIGVPAGFLNAAGGADRVTSVFGYPNALGLYFGPIVAVFVGFLFYNNPDSILLYLNNRSRFLIKLAVVVTGFLAIILAKSEGAIVAVVASACLLCLCNKKVRWYVLAGLIILVVLFVFDYFGLREVLWPKFWLLDWSGYVRRSIWLETIEMLKNNWFWGVGLAGYKLAIVPYHTNIWFETFPYPHNIVLNFWSELGLMGIAVFAFIIFKFVWVNLKNIFSIVWQCGRDLPFDKIASAVFLVAILEILIHGLVDVPYFKNDLSVLFWILLAVSTLNAKLKNNS